MQIKFTGQNIEVTDALRSVTKEKLERLERRFFRMLSINVTFKVEHMSHIVDATIQMPGESLHATAEANSDMYSAVDLLIDKLDKQLKKHKEKETHH